VLPSDNAKQISNFITVKNSLIVYYEGGDLDVIYTRDNLLHYQLAKGTEKEAPDWIRLDSSLESELSVLEFDKIAEAKTQQNSLFIHKLKR